MRPLFIVLFRVAESCDPFSEIGIICKSPAERSVPLGFYYAHYKLDKNRGIWTGAHEKAEACKES